MKRYNPSEIEPKWQKVWEETKIYQPDDASDKPKRYVLEYFPYPSGAAMHVGHVRNYTIGDAIARFSRMQGYNVLHPMGWDAFGLPAENYAIKTGITPRQAIDENTAKFKQQLTQMGFSYDWSREIDSTDPKYYRWTQSFFNLLFERGLAYQKDSLQWWCDFDKTVLANEQVEAGRCWRCGNTVTKKPLKQWFFKITDYAERLEADLDGLNWSDAIKSMQRNWIGRSIGAELEFRVQGSENSLTVFTTRADTLFGATFLVIAPEHPLLDTLTTPEQREHVHTYLKATQSKSDIERQETDREKTGVFTGAYALNPATQEPIPIWVADYVLMGYGTGAIMAVPAHDERDYAFAQKFGLPIVEVIEPETGTPQENPETRQSIVAIVRNPRTHEILTLNWGTTLGGTIFVGGGREDDESPVECAIREIREETGYQHLSLVARTGTIHHNYFAHSKNTARRIEATGLLFELDDEDTLPPQLEAPEENTFRVEWLSAAEVEAKVNDELHATVYRQLVKGECYHGQGILTASGEFSGLSSIDARTTIAQKFGQEKVNYRLRDWLISRQRYWGAPIPIIHCREHGAVAVPQDQLPVMLPPLDDFQPSDDGRSPLARVESWVQTTCPTCGGPAERETDTMDGFACSSWYFLRFADPHNDDAAFDPEKAKYWLPVDDYIGGAEHAVMHLLYARFWTKVMYDAGIISFNEPFTTLRNQGLILAPDGRKMSKSWGNVISPNDIIDQGYGADAIRVMELFIGPWNQEAAWSVEGMGGCYRFLNRVWTLTQEYLEVEHSSYADTTLDAIVNQAIKKVTDDLTNLSFNTAIATLMDLVNQLYKLKAKDNYADKDWGWALETLLTLLAPFAPHIAEELWQQTGHDGSIHQTTWPTYNETSLVKDTVTIVVQVNGKLRAKLHVAADTSEDDIRQAALTHEKVTAQLGQKEPARVVYVPGRLVNIVVK